MAAASTAAKAADRESATRRISTNGMPTARTSRAGEAGCGRNRESRAGTARTLMTAPSTSTTVRSRLPRPRAGSTDAGPRANATAATAPARESGYSISQLLTAGASQLTSELPITPPTAM